MRHTKDVEDRLYPTLRADNAEVVIYPWDRKYGALLIGGQGCGKTSALLSFYLNDIEDENAAPIVIDPKSELSRVCLRMTPPDCGKRVWFLDLGRPAFGMSPLRLIGDRPLAIEAAQIADNVVAALLDINENQIYQSSRRYLTHAVIGAIAIATKQGRRARLEDVYSLLRPAKDEFRKRRRRGVRRPARPRPDRRVLPLRTPRRPAHGHQPRRRTARRAAQQDLRPDRRPAAQAVLQPPRLTSPLREIVQARDILIVDANMGAIGTENSKACMLFILRMLHAQLQRQVHLPEAERPRVPLLVDEAHYVASGENVVDQIATHRAAGLEAAFGLQYFAQLGSASEHQQKILKGVLNLLQSRFLFRMGDAQDAEQATRIAMAVYATMIRDDPDSRARLRVTPEQALNFPNYYCLASWIANGTRAPSFMGQTYPLPDVGDEWAEHHLAAQDERVGPYPEQLESTLGIDEVPSAEPSNPVSAGMAIVPTPDAPPAASSAAPENAAESPGSSAKHEVQVDYEPPPARPPDLAGSPVRRVVGSAIAAQPEATEDHSTVGHSARPRVPRPDQRGRASRPARGREPAAETLRRGLRHPRAARPRRTCPFQPARPRRRARPRRPEHQRPPRQALPPRADRTPRHRAARALARGREIATAVLADEPRAPGRPGTHAGAGDISQAAVAGDRATPRRTARPRPPRARLGDRVPPPRRRARDRPLAHRPLRDRPLPRPPSRLRAASTSDHAQRDRGPRRPGDHRRRAEDVRRDQARPLAGAAIRTR